jgi:propanediol utilization protein
MDQSEIRAIVEQVVARYRDKTADTGTSVSSSPGEVLLEVSARHVHLTGQAVRTLFGEGAALHEKRPLSQPGQYLCEERVKLVTQKGVLDNVAVLGPERSEVQCELSLSDCRALGIAAPVNLSGDLSGAGDVVIIGPAGVLDAKGCVIAAKAHIHLPPYEAAARGLENDRHVDVRIKSARPVTLEDVIIRVGDNFAPAMHIDFDEANACGYSEGTKIEIVSKGRQKEDSHA